jgi:hypothetical protein
LDYRRIVYIRYGIPSSLYDDVTPSPLRRAFLRPVDLKPVIKERERHIERAAARAAYLAS